MPGFRERPEARDSSADTPTRKSQQARWLIPFVTFCVGLLLGTGLISLAAVRQARGVLSGDPERIRQVGLRRLERSLGLTDEQQQEFSRILRSVQEQTIDLRLEIQPEILAIAEEAVEEALALLDPRQRSTAETRFAALLDWIELTPVELEHELRARGPVPEDP